MATVKFAIPKGSIEDATFKILEEAWQTVKGRGRTYRVKLSDPEIEVKILRPQEIPTYVQEGFYDIGITGKDWIVVATADVNILLYLVNEPNINQQLNSIIQYSYIKINNNIYFY